MKTTAIDQALAGSIPGVQANSEHQQEGVNELAHALRPRVAVVVQMRAKIVWATDAIVTQKLQPHPTPALDNEPKCHRGVRTAAGDSSCIAGASNDHEDVRDAVGLSVLSLSVLGTLGSRSQPLRRVPLCPPLRHRLLSHGRASQGL